VGQRPVTVDGSLAANARFPANDVAGLTTPPPQSQADLVARAEAGAARVLPPPVSAGLPPPDQAPGLGAQAINTLTRGAGLEDAGRTAIAGFDDLGGALFSEDRSAHGVGSALGDIAKGGAGVVVNAPIRAARTAFDLTKAGVGGAINAGAGFLGFDAPPTSSAALADEPTGTLPVDTQGERSPFRADFDRAIENQIDIVAGTQPEPDVDNLLAGDGTGAQSLKAPPIAADSPDLRSFRGLDPIEVIRGTTRTLAFPRSGEDPITGETHRSDDPRAGLEVPFGFDAATEQRIGALTGIARVDRAEVINAMAALDDASARMTNAGANIRNAHANSTMEIPSTTGIHLMIMDDAGNPGFIDTGLDQLLEPMIGNILSDSGITKTSTPTLLYPKWDFTTGEPVIGPSGNQDIGQIQFSRLGIDEGDQDAQQKAIREWNEMAAQGFNSDEIIEALQE
jgi:hypothetical protein